MDFATLLRLTQRWTAGILLAMAAGSLVFGVGPVLYGVIAGGVVGWLNIEAIVRAVGWIARASEQQRLLVALLLPLKLLIVGALVYVLVVVVGVNALGFLAGVSGALFALVVAGRAARRAGRGNDRQESGTPE